MPGFHHGHVLFKVTQKQPVVHIKTKWFVEGGQGVFWMFCLVVQKIKIWGISPVDRRCVRHVVYFLLVLKLFDDPAMLFCVNPQNHPHTSCDSGLGDPRILLAAKRLRKFRHAMDAGPDKVGCRRRGIPA